jgi:hypothetical protein
VRQPTPVVAEDDPEPAGVTLLDDADDDADPDDDAEIDVETEAEPTEDPV